MDGAHASRPEGYYWVVRSGCREIAHWDAGVWWRFADEHGYSDASFEKIDERPIIQDEKDVDGRTYGFSNAPRSLTESIIVILKDRERAWIRYNFSSPVLEVFWDASPDSEGWTTGGCDRLRDDELECWRRMPPRRAERAVEARGPSAAARPGNYSGLSGIEG